MALQPRGPTIGDLPTDLETVILDFESQWWQARGNEEAAIREEFDWTPIRYAQKLNAVLDDLQAIEYDPQLVNRLRRIQNRRTEQRKQRAVIYSDDKRRSPWV